LPIAARRFQRVHCELHLWADVRGPIRRDPAHLFSSAWHAPPDAHEPETHEPGLSFFYFLSRNLNFFQSIVQIVLKYHLRWDTMGCTLSKKAALVMEPGSHEDLVAQGAPPGVAASLTAQRTHTSLCPRPLRACRLRRAECRRSVAANSGCGRHRGRPLLTRRF